MAKTIHTRQMFNVPQRIDEDRAQYIARKIMKIVAREKLPDILSATFGVSTHTVLRLSNTVEQALDNVDRLATDMKHKLLAVWAHEKSLDLAQQQVARELKHKQMELDQKATAVGRPQ